MDGLLEYDFHPPDDLRLFQYEIPSVLRFDDTALVVEVDYCGTLLRHYSFPERWFKINCTTDLSGNFVEDQSGSGPMPFSFNCDIATPMLRQANAVFGVDLWRAGRDWTGYEGLSISGIDAIFDCLMDGTACITSKAGWKWDDVIWNLGMRLSDIAHQDMLIRAETTEDILRARQNGQIAFIPSLETATPIENELDRLDILYGLGIRSSGIAYSEANTLGSGLREKETRD